MDKFKDYIEYLAIRRFQHPTVMLADYICIKTPTKKVFRLTTKDS
jgi:hypothetical protein